MSSPTDRWFASSRRTYARALLDLATYARTHEDDFSLGPLDVAALDHQGLAVTGPDLTGVREVLGKIPGLTQEQGGDEHMICSSCKHRLHEICRNIKMSGDPHGTWCDCQHTVLDEQDS